MNLENMKRNKKLWGSLLMIMFAPSILSGCSESEYEGDCWNCNETAVDCITSQNDFHLLEDLNLVALKTYSVRGEEKIYFARKIDLISLTNLNSGYQLTSDYEYYKKYYDGNLATTNKTYVYFDIMDGSIISIKYIRPQTLVREEMEKYKFNKIIEEDLLYNYATSYIGDKDTYTREEILNMLEDVRQDSEKILIKK